jgi:hypothetical protein
MKYRIAWEVMETGCVEKGNLLYGNPHEAHEIARMLNETWPEFRHWVEPLEAAAEPKATSASQEDAA